jgi:hypothetical protein
MPSKTFFLKVKANGLKHHDKTQHSLVYLGWNVARVEN